MALRLSANVDSSTLMWLLRVSLFGGPCVGFPKLSEAEWDALFQYSMRHKVVGFVNRALPLLPPESRPSRKILLRFYVEGGKVRARSVRQSEVLASLVDFFDSMGVDTMLLKGAFLSECYPEPHIRSYGDLDIYQFGRYREADAMIAKYHGIRVSDKSPHHTKYCFMGVTVENHYDFLNTRAFRSNRPLERLLKSMVGEPRRGGCSNGRVCLPSPDFNAVFLIRHLAGHFAAGQVTVRDLCDWRMFLHRYAGQVDWPQAWRIYEQYNMHRFVGALQGILEDHLALDPVPGLPRGCDPALQQRVFNEILFGEFSEPDYRGDGFGRLLWKIRRYRANGWKHALVYSDSRLASLCSGLVSHLLKPYSILHKV